MRSYIPTKVFLIWIASLVTLIVPLQGQDQISTDTGVLQSGTSEVFARTTGLERLRAHERRTELRQTSPFSAVPFRSVGPTVMSGRVVDVAVNPTDPTHFYVAYASGGLWETRNNGVSFEPILDSEATMTLGDIAVAWGDTTLWAGTGENNASRSSYAGTGLYRSRDGGKTWTSMGLLNSHRIGRIRIHPDNPNVIWVASSGPLYSSGGDRGVYKTTDGGESWTRVLYSDDETGAIDLEVHPTNPDILYAALWTRGRSAWNFVESGTGSGLYKSTDGGDTWISLTNLDSGLPSGKGLGRIGIAIAPSQPDRVYLLIDNQDLRPDEGDKEEEGVTKEDLREMNAEEFAKLDVEDIEDYLRSNGFPRKYTAKKVRSMVASGEIAPNALVTFLEDANSQLFDTNVIGAEVYVSDDGGTTWKRTHEDYLDRVYNTYGYYFGQIRVSPSNPDRIYIMGVPLLASSDGGATFSRIDGPHVHVDHHALWINPENPRHLINGNDGGLNISYDDGWTWIKANAPPVGQFYTVQVDNAKPYNVYGGLQDNGVWFGPSTYEHSYSWYGSGDYSYQRLLGGDGMQVEVDTRNNEVVYTGFQFGFYFRINTSTGKRSSIRPTHALGERPLRFNWQTPIHLSRHNQDILYFGSNKLHRSLDRGDSWEAISDDLTHGGRQGDVPFGTLTTIDESPLQFGLIYTGSDDGLVFTSPDGGVSWENISNGLPDDLWVSRVEASAHDIDRVYVSLNGYRQDHFGSYVYVSENRGASWVRLGTDLPAEPVNVVLEDPAAENVLFIGTDHAVYVSTDRGATFAGLAGGLPDAPIHDLKIQQRESDLVVGSHGRSIFIADLEPIRSFKDYKDSRLHVLAIAHVDHRSGWGNRSAVWTDFAEPQMTIGFFAGQGGEVTIGVYTESGVRVHEWEERATAGINYVDYDLTVTDNRRRLNRWLRRAAQEEVDSAENGKTYLGVGKYELRISSGKTKASSTFEVKGREVETVVEPSSRPDEKYRIK